MDKKELDQRIAELKAERERLSGELDKARIEAREAMIAGKKPGGTAAALAERIAIVDDALVELQDRSRGAAESAERNNRRRRAEAALDATSKRAKLAAAVDEALNALASSWDDYADALRKDVGQVSGAGGDLTAVERALTNNRAAEPLVKALIQSGGVKLARTFGIETPIRDRHAISLADAEARVPELDSIANAKLLDQALAAGNPTTGPKPSSWTGEASRYVDREAFTYAFRFGSSDVWKIGYAVDVNERLKQVNCHIPTEVIPEVWIAKFRQRWESETDAYAMEQRVLKALDHHRTEGERVRCSEEQLWSAWLNGIGA